MATYAPWCSDADSGQGWDVYCAAVANVACQGTVYDLENPGLAGFEDSLYKLKRAAYAMTECAATRQATLHSFFSTLSQPEPSTASQPSPVET